MMELLSTWYGLSGVGIVLLLVFFIYLKVVGWIWKIALFALLTAGAYFYFRSFFGN